MELDFSGIDKLAECSIVNDFFELPEEKDSQNTILTLGDIKKCRALQREISADIMSGYEQPYTILLKAVEAMAILLKDHAYYERVRQELLLILGEALEKEEPLEILLRDIKNNLHRIENTLHRTTLKDDTRQKLHEAKEELEARAKDISDKLKKQSQRALKFEDVL